MFSIHDFTRSMNLLIDRIKGGRLVIGGVGATLVVADGDAVVVGRRELAAQPDVVDARLLVAVVGGEEQRQVVDAGELGDPARRWRGGNKSTGLSRGFYRAINNQTYLVVYSRRPVWSRCSSNV